MLQAKRDGVYSVQTTNPVSGIKPQLITSNVVVTDATATTGDNYTIDINIVSTPTPGTTTLTYTLTNTSAVPAITPTTGSLNFPTGGSFTIPDALTPGASIPGASLTFSGTPAAGDKITVDASASLFGVLDDAIQNIGSSATSAAASQAVSNALSYIDAGFSRVSAVRGLAGDLLNRADRISANQEVRSIQLEADRSRAEDLDMIKGISDFQNQQTGYQAALQSYAQIQKLSLFNFIG